jgi:protein-S-isoprenylcysteine O-methyltransferase Ste14
VPVAGLYPWCVVAEFALAALTALGLGFVVAPYGRHGRPGWGPTVPARVGWLVMESVAPTLFAVFFFTGSNRGSPVPLLLCGLWQAHYLQRAFVYPLLMRSGNRMPAVVAALAIAFNVLNAYVNGRWIGQFGRYPQSWLADPRFILGVAVFIGGLALNLRSDHTLRHLRGPGETGYRIPTGGGFRWVSCPNYLGEIVEWLGWALATWSLAGLSFAVYTIANLGPRARQNHRWYLDIFPDYPPRRRAIVPYLL